MLGWFQVCSRLPAVGMPPVVVDVGILALKNILPLQTCCHRLHLTNSPACRRSGAAVEDVINFSTVCPRVRMPGRHWTPQPARPPNRLSP
jgi:hypothetical protein